MFRATRALSFAAGFIALGALVGCSDSHDIGGLDASQSRPEWAIQLVSTCSDTAPEDCVAGYPYTVGADGVYRIGPGPQGQLLSGKLSSEEFASLQKLYFDASASARAFSTQQHAENATCSPLTIQTDSASDRISIISRAGDQAEWLRVQDQKLCTHLESSDATQKLLAWMHESALNHYPVPFPDDNCDDARATLEALYGSVRGCTTDADCAFIDETFQPIAQDYLTFLLKGDCTGAQPLVVANRSRVAAKRSALLQFFSHAQEACKRRAASQCAGFSDFQPTRPAPICGGGVCHARSS